MNSALYAAALARSLSDASTERENALEEAQTKVEALPKKSFFRVNLDLLPLSKTSRFAE